MEFLLIAFVLTIFVILLILESNMNKEFDKDNAFNSTSEEEAQVHAAEYAKYVAHFSKTLST